MRTGLAFACALSSLSALSGELTVQVVDEANRAIPNAFVIGREFVNVPQFHGSHTYCDRADVARAAGGAHEVTLPLSGVGKLAPGRHYALEAFAYAPGYCIERTPSAYRGAMSNALPAAWRSAPAAIASGSTTELRARRVAAAEERLEYLASFSRALACPAGSWSRRSDATLKELAAAMTAEADQAATTKYAKMLARQVRENLAQAAHADTKQADALPRGTAVLIAPTDQFARDFLVAPAHYRVQFPPADAAPGRPAMAIASAGGGASYGVARAATAPGAPAGPATIVMQGEVRATAPAATPASGLAIHCRNGAPSQCNLDERDALGQTAISRYATELNVEAVQLLIAHGANPSAPSGRSGTDAFEALVARLIMNPPALGSINADNAIRILAIMASSPKATLRAGLRTELETPEAQWFAQTPEARAVLLRARDTLRGVRERPDPLPCEAIEDETMRYGALPVRLKAR